MKMTAKQVKRALGEDFLERDGKSFVFHGKSCINWMNELKEDEAFSKIFFSYIDKNRDVEDHIKNVVGIASSLLRSLDLPKPVRVTVNKKGDSYTDSITVNVGTSVFDDPNIDILHKFDVFLGLAFHEGLHCETTDFQLHDNDRIVMELANIIEDERIEHFGGQKYSNFANFLKATKYYFFGRYEMSRKEIDFKTKEGYFYGLINAILKLIRYPSALTDKELTTFQKYLILIKNLLYSFPKNTEETFNMARAIRKIIEEAVTDYLEENEDMDDHSSETGEKDEESDSSSETKGKDAKSDSSSETGKKDAERDSGRGDSSKSKSISDKKNKRASGETEMMESVRKEMEMIADEIESACTFLTKNDKKCQAVTKNDRIDEYINGEVEYGQTKNVLFEKCGNPTSEMISIYDSEKAEINKYINPIKKSVFNAGTTRKFLAKGCKTGLLDTGKLAEAVQGCDNIYTRARIQKSNNIAVCILIDQSGSMCRSGRIQAARKCAILLNEAFGKCPQVDLFIYGHTADSYVNGPKVNIFTYREHGVCFPKGLGMVEALNNNMDGVAILNVARRVRSQTKDRCIFFVLSDGQPAASNYIGLKACEHTKECVDKISQDGFFPIQIAINSYDTPVQMFKNVIQMTELDKLPFELCKLVKKYVINSTSKK